MKMLILQTEWGKDSRKTLEQVELKIREECSKDSYNFIVLPEFFLGPPQFVDNTELNELVERRLCQLAEDLQVYIISGTVLKQEGEIYYNASLVIDFSGSVIAEIRKEYTPKDIKTYDSFPVYDTKFGKIGVVLGQDAWLAEVPRILSLKGAEIIFVLGNTNAKNLEEKITALWGMAVLNCVLIVYCSSVGNSEHELIGNSAVATPKKIIARASDQEEIIRVEIEDSLIAKLREPDLSFNETLWWGLWNRKPDLYRELLAG